MIDDLFDEGVKYYLPNKGVLSSKTQIYNEYLHELYRLIFKIYDDNNLDYYVFAGSAVGYVRDGKNLPWADDYDIIIFEKEKDKFDKIIPILTENGFNVGFPHLHRPDLYPNHVGWQISRTKQLSKCTFFLCDVFLTRVDENNFIRNMGNFGVYTNKNIPLNLVEPKVFIDFDGIKLPFFNNISEYVKLEYGDVINTVKIYVNHSALGVRTIKTHWTIIYEEFEKIKKEAKENTRTRIITNPVYNGTEVLTVTPDLGQKFSDEFSVLEYLNKNNIGEILIYDISFIRNCFNIKYYYPKMRITMYLSSLIDIDDIFQFNYIDSVVVELESLKTTYFESQISFLNKPLIR